jgi:hypothetical protein
MTISCHVFFDHEKPLPVGDTSWLRGHIARSGAKFAYRRPWRDYPPRTFSADVYIGTAVSAFDRSR